MRRHEKAVRTLGMLLLATQLHGQAQPLQEPLKGQPEAGRALAFFRCTLVPRQAPEGLQSNWIPTAGKRPLPALRFYGGTDALFDKQFKMPDFERLDQPAATAVSSAMPAGLAMGSHLLP